MCAILIVFFGSMAISKDPLAFADCNAEKEIYLTFDDGPSDRVTPKILDVLKEENVKATFFIVGRNIPKREKIIKREIDEGHGVAVHSFSHRYGEIYSSPENLLKDIEKCSCALEQVTGVKPTYYRFPGGGYGLDEKFISAVKTLNLNIVDWNASTCDAELLYPTPEEIYKCAVNTAADKDRIILLAHDSTTKTATAKALGSIIRYYKERGYTFKAFK